MRVIKLDERISRVNIEEWQASDRNNERLCILSEADITVIRAMLWPAVEWPTRLGKPISADLWQIANGVEFSEYSEAMHELDYKLSRGLEMSLEDAFNNIADAILALANAQSSSDLSQLIQNTATSNVCCEQTIINQGGGVSGSVTQPVGENVTPIYGVTPPLSLPESGVPEGFETLEEYQLSKCQIANAIVNGVIETLRYLGAIGVFEATATAAVVVLAITGAILFPPALIPILCASIGILSVGVTFLTLAANYIRDNRQEWVCVLYNSDSTDTAVSLLADLIDALVGAIGTSSPQGAAVKQIILLLVNSDTLNQLFKKTSSFSYPDADCSDCGEGEELCFTFDADVQGWVSWLVPAGWYVPGSEGEVGWGSAGSLVSTMDYVDGYWGCGCQVVIEPYIVQSGDVFVVRFTEEKNYPMSVVFGIEADSVEQQIYINGGLGGETVCIEVDLSAYVGQEVTRMMLNAGSTSQRAVPIDYVGINCPLC